MDSFGLFDRGAMGDNSSSFGRGGGATSRFDREMTEASTSSRASNLQKLMEKETENIRQWKVRNRWAVLSSGRKIFDAGTRWKLFASPRNFF